MKSLFQSVVAFALLSLLSACCLFDSLYYRTMESFGFQKRDILTSKVEKARDAQKETAESFQSALERFSSVLEFEGGDLQKAYDKLSAELSRCESRVEALDKRIASVRDVADALFREWKSELSQYKNEELRRDSQLKLQDTRRQYDQLLDSMLAARKRVDPVLDVFRDQVLYLKHNLNARALSTVRNESLSVAAEVQSLIDDLSSATAEADRFISALSD